MAGFHIRVMGCQMNEYDGAALRSRLLELGMTEVSENQAEIVVLLTCVVRQKPQRKAEALIKRFKAMGKKVVVAGCLSRLAKTQLENQGVDVLLPGEYHKIEHVLGLGTGQGLEKPGKPLGPSAFLKIAEGCDNFCSYCVVPFVRGRERYKAPEEVVEEAVFLESQGVKELTLLGQNVNSYFTKGVDFPDLLAMVHDATNIPFIKFTTSHPRDLNYKLIETVAHRPRLSKWFHLPLQSGSDRILVAMNRGYTSGEYLEKIDMIKTRVDQAVITTDIMVGFPGETEQDFEDTCRMVEKVGFDRAYMFAYNDRPHTASWSMTPKVQNQVKSARLRQLIDLTLRVIEKQRQRFVGSMVQVLCDEHGCRSSQGLAVELVGRTRPGQIITARITGLRGLTPVAMPCETKPVSSR